VQRLGDPREVALAKNETQNTQVMKADVVIIQHWNELYA
jgi:hypothetical protein